MELALFIKRSISLTTIILLLAAFSGCIEKPAGKTDSTPQQDKKADKGSKSDNDVASRVAGPVDVNAKSGIPDTDKAPLDEKVGENKKTEASANEKAEEKEPLDEEPVGRKMPDLGSPLVDHPENLKRLDPDSPVWLDKENKRIVLLGTVCKANYPLEFFATYEDRGYESVVVIYNKPSVVHAALLALDAKPGKPVQFEPEYAPPSGMEVAIDLVWKDQDGKQQKAKAQDWIRDIKTKKPLDVNWVFTGSMFWEDKETGEKSYLADRGDFISVLNLPTALLDVPIKSASSIESRLFEGATDKLPPTGTPVTMILTPKIEAGTPINSNGQSLMKMVDPKSVIQEEEESKMGLDSPSEEK